MNLLVNVSMFGSSVQDLFGEGLELVEGDGVDSKPPILQTLGQNEFLKRTRFTATFDDENGRVNRSLHWQSLR